MPQEDIESHAGLLIIAGSETTATLLSGCTFLLLNNPDALERLTREVRSTFKEESEITINSAGQLEYMLACLDEALRCYPPVPIGNPRVIPKGGRVLCGKYVPEDVSRQLFSMVDIKRTPPLTGACHHRLTSQSGSGPPSTPRTISPSPSSTSRRGGSTTPTPSLQTTRRRRCSPSRLVRGIV